ncbi:hypothetical protein ACFRAR_27050, partial [Kitasatospora sp. NPDC056651]
MSGATGAAGGTSGGRPGAQGGGSYGVPQPPNEHSAASTSLMPPTGGAGQAGAGGFSQPTTYAKGQPTPARGTRVPGGNTPPGGTPAVGPA